MNGGMQLNSGEEIRPKPTWPEKHCQLCWWRVYEFPVGDGITDDTVALQHRIDMHGGFDQWAWIPEPRPGKGIG